MQVGSVRRGLEVVAVRNLQPVHQILARLSRHRCGHAEHSDALKHGSDFAEAGVVRTEVGAPLAHAVRLVDYYQLDPFLHAQHVHEGQHCVVHEQPFRSQEQQLRQHFLLSELIDEGGSQLCCRQIEERGFLQRVPQ